MVDEYGISEIKGTLKGRKLTFNKKYVDSQDNIIFNLTRGGYSYEASTFIGAYEGKNRGEDSVKCLLSNECLESGFAFSLIESSMDLAKRLMRISQ